MPKKSNKYEFIEKSKKIFGNTYNYDNVIYINNKTTVMIKCKKHGDFLKRPDMHLQGQGCPRCSKIKSFEDFKNKSNEIFNNKYNYDYFEWTNNEKKIKIKCLEHGYFYQKINYHLNGYGCPECNKNIMNKNKFIKKSNEIHNNKYDYSKLNYKKMDEKGIIICPEHGEFEQILNYHYNGSGCPKCKGKNMTTEDFIKKSKKLHGNKYDYSLVNYEKSNKKINIICPKHGEFKQIPNHHLSGRGCPKCRLSKGEKEIEKLLNKFNIKYESQKKFEGCSFILPLKFDFYLPEYKTCIEYDGEQHFKKYKFEKDDKKLLLRKKRDNIKNSYCKNNNINLIRIKYDENIEKKIKLFKK